MKKEITSEEKENKIREYYNKYAGKITCAFVNNVFLDKDGKERCNAKRTEEREKYIFSGITENVILIECPKDMIAIEFENHDNIGGKEVDKDKIKEWINKLQENAKDHKIDYCICDHGGTSPWFYACNFSNMIEGKEKECKKEFAKIIIPEEAYPFLDLSNLGNTLIPIIEKPHWKFNKYKGVIHKIVAGKLPGEHKNKIPEVIIQRVLDREKNFIVMDKIFDKSEEDINSIPLTKIFSLGGMKKRNNEYQGANPIHGSSTGTNFCINTSKNVWNCFRCGCGGGSAKAIALTKGVIRTCSDDLSSEQFKEVLKIAKEQYGLKSYLGKKKKKDKTEEKNDVEEYNGINLKDINLIKEKAKEFIFLKKKSQLTELVVSYIKNNNYIYTTKDDLKSEVWIYKNGIYVPQGRSEISEIVRFILEEAYTSHLCNEVIAKIEADTFIEQEIFFKSNYLEEIPVSNGILNIMTKKISDFNPKKIFFNKLPIEYNPEAKCKKIIEHFKTVLRSEEDVPVMLELFGYLLYKEYKIEKAFMFVGGGRNGKSKTIELMKRFLGVENCSAIPLKSMHEESFDIWELFGKMGNLAGDLSKTDLKETGMFKLLVGRDTISAKRKFLTAIKFTNYAKMIFACNELPLIYDLSDGFWTKWVLMEFPYKFVTENEYYLTEAKERKYLKIMNPDIVNQISTPEEMSGLLNESIGALHRLLKKGDFSYSVGTKEIKDIWLRKANSFMAFCMDCLTENYEIKIPKHVIRKAYALYCKNYKVKQMSDRVIKSTLEEEFGANEERSNVDGQFIRVWEGITFKENIIESLKNESFLKNYLNIQGLPEIHAK
jgi:P4 family phage/plasmid primase-like protien